MNANIYIGGLPYSTTEEELTDLLQPFGLIKSVFLPENRESTQFNCAGFAFCEYVTDVSAARAIDGLNNFEFKGRRLNVAYARPKKPFNGSSDRRSLAGGD